MSYKDPEYAFRLAETLYEVVHREQESLNNKLEPLKSNKSGLIEGPPYHFAPIAILSSFCLELYMKYMLITRGIDFPKKHDLDKLFEILHEDDKRQIEQLYQREIGMDNVRRMLKDNGQKIFSSAEELFNDAAHATAFRKWRYLYEENYIPPRTTYHFWPILDAVRKNAQYSYQTVNGHL